MMAPKDKEGDAGLLLHFGGGGGRTLVNGSMEAKQQQQQQQQQPVKGSSATASASASATSSARASPANSADDNGSRNGSTSRNGDSVKSNITHSDTADNASNVKSNSSVVIKSASKNGGKSGKGSSKHHHSKGHGHPKTGFSIKKKKKRDKSRDKSSSRSKKRGMNREARMATDTTVNTLKTLRSVVFQRESYISNPVPTVGHRRVVNDFQFEDAPEVVDHAMLKQHHSSESGSKTRPPFGYFSIHPSSLSLHPETAVRHYYPLTIHMMEDSLHQYPHQQPHQHQHQQENIKQHQHHHQQQEQPNHKQHPTLQVFPHPGFRTGFTGSDPSPGHHGGIAQLPHPNMVAMNHPQHHPQLQQAQMSQQHHVQLHQQHQRHQHPGMSPGTTQHPLVNIPTKHLPTNLVPGLTPQQQTALHHQYQQQAQHQHGRPPSFLEYAAAFVKRQQVQQQQQQQHLQSQQIPHQQQQQGLSQEQMQQVKLQREESLKKDQLERAAMLKNALKNVTGVPRVRPNEQQQQQQHKRQQQQPQGGSRHRVGAAEESPSAAGTSAERSGVSAMMALAAAREVGDPATAAALLQNFAHQKRERSEPNRSQAKPDLSSTVMVKRIRPKMPREPDEENLEESSPMLKGTDLLETLPMLKYTPPDVDKSEPVTDRDFRQCDVLLGRGGMTNHHIGNTHFRSLVSKFRYNYHAAKKGAKGQLSKKLANFVRHKGGRFLQKDEVENVWYECGDQRAHGKCAQALREGSAEVMREATAMEAVERDRQRVLPKSSPKVGIYPNCNPYAANEYINGQNSAPRPVMPRHPMPPSIHPGMNLSAAHRAATGQHMSPHTGMVQGGQLNPTNHSESPVVATDENQARKASRVRARDWENEGGLERSSGDDDDDEAGDEEEEEDPPASKRTKNQHDDENEDSDYI